MVLRKQPPPRLENLHKGNAYPATRSPTSPTSASSHRRPLNGIPSQESIYSPDLNTSPAFDLMPLEEAQRSPVGSPTTYPPNSWTENRDDRTVHMRSNSETYPEGTMHKTERIPVALDTQQQPVPGSHRVQTGDVPVQLRSNNPFLKPRKPVPSQATPDRPDWSRDSNTTTISDPLSQTDGYIPMTARLSLLDAEEQGSSWADQEATHSESHHAVPSDLPRNQSPWGSQHSIEVSAAQEIFLQGGQTNPHAPAVVIQPSGSTEDHYSLQPPYSHDRLGSDAGAHSPSVFSSATSATSHELIDMDSHENLGVAAGSQKAASSTYSADGFPPKSETGALLDAKSSPAVLAPPQQAQEDKPATILQTPSVKLTPAEEVRHQEQRSETYSIRQVNWKDRTGNMQQSPILVQNNNGPCPLLALINALVLRADANVQPPIVKALRTREQISLGLLIEALFEELITRLGPDDQFPDIEALSRFLTMLHTGLNVNPRLTLETNNSLGTFLQTSDLQLYSTFGVPLIHGWVASWSSTAHSAMTRVAEYHEDIQLLHFRKQELEDWVMGGESLSPAEEQEMADIQAIQNFVEVDNATQLSPFGLTQLSTRLAPGSVSIFFRNDHFSTLYKHPESHQLFMLVTDAGYANHAEVVWESLVDVTGFNSEFLAGDFRAVGHGPSGSAGPTGVPTSSAPPAADLAPATESSGRLSPQEQADADYAYALSLQFQEEEQRERTNSSQGSLPTSPRSNSQHGLNDHPRNPNRQRMHDQQTSDNQQRPYDQLGNNNRQRSYDQQASDNQQRNYDQQGNNSRQRNNYRNSAPLRSPNSSSIRMNNPPSRSSSTTNTVGIRPARQPHSDPDPDDPNAPPPPYEATNRPRYSPPARPSPFTEFPSEYSSNQYPGNRNPRYNRYSTPANSQGSSRPDPERYNPNQRNKDCVMM
ncbi:hypothetical protein N7454_009375 [Penicillium verhagenii]|nr:hypothetical protein N7454_009375 [Penicillium verhagenii]